MKKFLALLALFGAVTLAAITSCTNTSNPSVMIAAGLLAKKAVDKDSLVRVPTELIIQALDYIEQTLDFSDGYSFDWEACRAAVEYYTRIAPQDSKGQCWLAVKTGRTLGRKRSDGVRFSNAPHTYQDRALVHTADGDLPVLMFFRQEGREEDGWRNTPFYWPVLFAPTNAKPSVFASTIREEDAEIDEQETA